MSRMMTPHLALCLAAVVACLLAMMPGWEYGFYMLVRVIVCLAAVMAAPRMKDLGHEVLMVSCWVLAVLYNPIFKVHLTKDLWWWINGVTAVLLAVCADKMRNALKAGR